jgi:hypothetical protein
MVILGFFLRPAAPRTVWFGWCGSTFARLAALAIGSMASFAAEAAEAAERPIDLKPFFSPPRELAGYLGSFQTPLRFDDGREVKTPEDWARRRQEILRHWHQAMGGWPRLLERPGFTVLSSTQEESITFHQVRLEIGAGRFEHAWLLVPPGSGRFPAVVVPFYEPETSIGRKGRLRDFGWQLARRGFVTLSIGSPGGDARRPEPAGTEAKQGTDVAVWQPLSFLAFVAANAHTALSQRPEVDPKRIGIVGHSYGGKWALFAGALHEPFACIVVSDPGIVWDEGRPNVNYWEPWYLGRDPRQTRQPGVISPERPRTGAYRELVEQRRDLTDLHALLAPRPFLVSGGAEDPPERWRALNHLIAVNRLLGVTNRVAMTNRSTHDPNPESNEQIYAFFREFLRPTPPPSPRSP